MSETARKQSCPCCGAPIDRMQLNMLPDLRLTGQHRKIINCLVENFPRAVSVATLIEVLYGNDADGGPNDPRSVIAVRVCRIRPQLETTGWTIEKNKGTGYGAYGGYRLVQVAA